MKESKLANRGYSLVYGYLQFVGYRKEEYTSIPDKVIHIY